MNAPQRRPYLRAVEQSQKDCRAGTRKGWLPLCEMCRYFRSMPATYYDDGDAECLHPLQTVSELQFDRAFNGGDCFAFRPTKAAREEIHYDGQYHAERGERRD